MTQREQFLAAADVLMRESGVTVRKYRKRTTGTAYIASDDWEIEAPKPVTATSFSVFAHEVGHQLLHREGSRPRWLEEVEAWEFAFAQFERFNLPGIERARPKAAKHLRYMVGRSITKLKPGTALAILTRYPLWVWETDDPRDAVVTVLPEALHFLAEQA